MIVVTAGCISPGSGRVVSFQICFRRGLILATIAVGASAQSYSQTTNSGAAISIELKNNSEREHQTKAQLERLLAAYDLRKYTFTHAVLIDE